MPPKSARSGEYIETDNGNKISRRAQLHATQHIILAGKSVIQHDVIIRGDLVRQQPAASSSTKPALDPSTGKPTPTPQTQTVSIHLGRHVFISPGCTLHPPSRLTTIIPPSSISTTTAANPNVPNSALTSTSSDLATRRLAAQAAPLSPLSTVPQNQPQPQPLDPPAPKPTSQTPTAQTLTYYPLRISSHVYLGPHTYCAAAQIGSHVFIGARCTLGNMVIIKDCVRVEDDTVLPPNTVWRSGVVVAGRPARVVGRVGEGWVNGGEREGDTAAGGEGGFEGWGKSLWASVGNAGTRRKE